MIGIAGGIAIFVDDIGITASRVSYERMGEVASLAERLLVSFDLHQKLPTNFKKRKIRPYGQGVEHLGLKLGRNKLSMGGKAQSRRDKVRKALRGSLAESEKIALARKKKAYWKYQQQIRKA